MKSTAVCTVLAVIVVTGMACRAQPAEGLAPVTLALENGIRVLVLHVPDSTNASIFTFLPMGLASDGSGQTQWAHLVEHLVIRSTVIPGSREANAETLPDHMRLDFYGTTANWEEGLSHHAQWLRGSFFTEESLATEKPLANSECDTVARNLATHKFAMAAWAQGHRFGSAHAAVKGDLARASLAEIQKHRDECLPVLDRAVVCIVGGLDAETVKPVVTEQLGALTSAAKAPAPVQAPGGDHDMTWDLQAHHIVLTWPIPDVSAADYPALLAAGQLLSMQFFSDQELKTVTGMVLAGADLATPEGQFFYVSASVRPGVQFGDVLAKLDAHIQQLAADDQALSQAPQFGQQVSQMMTTMPDPAAMKAQAPPGMDAAMLEGNIGLQFAMHEYRYGSHKQAVADALALLTASDVKQAIGNYLTPEKRAVCTLTPGADG